MKDLVQAFLKIQFPLGFISGLMGALIVKGIQDFELLGGDTVDILFIVFVLIAIATLVQERMKLQSIFEGNSRITTSIFRSTFGTGRKNRLYDEMAKFVSSAQESIQIVHVNLPLTQITDEERDNYFSQLEQTIKKHSQQESNFRYERIMQSDESASIVRFSQRDRRLYEHYITVRDLENTGNIPIYLRVMPRIAGQVGFILVDKRRVFITFPTPKIKESTSESIGHAIGMIFDDPTSDLVREMSRIFGDLRDVSRQIADFKLDDETS